MSCISVGAIALRKRQFMASKHEVRGECVDSMHHADDHVRWKRFCVYLQ
jgi:hypothetical protein